MNHKKMWRRIWRDLTPAQRAECRREYRHLREALGLDLWPAEGIVNRMASMATWPAEDDK